MDAASVWRASANYDFGLRFQDIQSLHDGPAVTSHLLCAVIMDLDPYLVTHQVTDPGP